jgi:hypothetical protein
LQILRYANSIGSLRTKVRASPLEFASLVFAALVTLKYLTVRQK